MLQINNEWEHSQTEHFILLQARRVFAFDISVSNAEDLIIETPTISVLDSSHVLIGLFK